MTPSSRELLIPGSSRPLNNPSMKNGSYNELYGVLGMVSPENILRHYQSHDLRGTLSNSHQPCVSPMAMNIKLVRITISAVNLYSLIANVKPAFCSHKFGLGGFRLERPTLILQPCGSVYHEPGRVYLSQHISDLGLDHLEV